MEKSIQILVVFSLMIGTSTYVKAQVYPEMISVSGGTFLMGDEHGEGDEDEQPLHSVTLKTFKIAKTETSVVQWKAYCKATGRAMPQAPSWGWIDSHPIVNIDYTEAVAYCDWLGEVMDADYRLPTEAEWEYAARQGTFSKSTKYNGGKKLKNLGWYLGNSEKKTHPVASKKSNRLGLYDMNGNVWEWCRDWFGEYSDKSQTDPRGPSSGYARVLRGGSWRFSEVDCRVSVRNYSTTNGRSEDFGFRVALYQ